MLEERTVLTHEQKNIRGLWFIITFFLFWIFYWLLSTRGVINSSESSTYNTLNITMAFIATMGALILVVYQIQWRRASGKYNFIMNIFDFSIYPLLTVSVPIKFVAKKFDLNISFNQLKDFDALLIALVLVGSAVYIVLIGGVKLFQWKQDFSINEASEYETNRERANIIFYHTLVGAVLIWLVFF